MGIGPARGIDGTPFSIDGVEFVPTWDRPSAPGSLSILKAERLVEPYRQLLAETKATRVFELGIHQGGSVALLALLCRPTKLLAIDLSPEPVAALLETIESLGMSETVKPYFGVDQGDAAALRKILDDELGDETLDVVIDDASHLYGPTRASFDVLFPRLRPGGLYVIEDWTWQDTFAGNFAKLLEVGAKTIDEDKLAEFLTQERTRDIPVSAIAHEAVMARAYGVGAIAEVTVDEDWITIRRGDGELGDDFTLGGSFADHYRILDLAT